MKRFAFLDFETTGFDEQVCAPIELAVVVTDERLAKLSSLEELIIPTPTCVWEPVAREMHDRSGLALRAALEGKSLLAVQYRLTAFLSRFAGPAVSLHPAGNSVHMDVRFLRRYFPEAAQFFHYRILDVSSIRMLAEAAGHPPLDGEKPHRAMADVRRSLEDARRFLGVLRCP